MAAVAAQTGGQSRDNIAQNLRALRGLKHLSLEEVAERIGVSRQAVAKWENGDSLPDILNCEALANLFDVSLNDLVQYNAAQAGAPIPPKDKHLFATVTLNDKGQIVLPKKARDVMGYKPGDVLVVMGDTNPANRGLALMDAQAFMRTFGFSAEGLGQK